MYVRCYGQSWYKYQICIAARMLIFRYPCDRVVDGRSWSDSHTKNNKTKNLGGSLPALEIDIDLR